MKRTPIERFLGLFTEVRPGEGTTALLMFANVFLILSAYYFVKPLREGWIAISGFEGLTKMEVKAYTSFAQSLVLLFVVAGYARLSDRVPRATLITYATAFCMTNLVGFWFLQPNFFLEHLPGTGVLFYLWVGMFGVFIVAQFWAFAADLYTQERGERLIPLIAIGATAGAACGAGMTDWLVDLGIVSSKFLLLAALVPLTASIVLTRIVDRREDIGTQTAQGAGSAPEPPREKPPPDGRSALGVIVGSRYLLAVAFITLLTNWVNTNGENLLFGVMQESLAAEAAAAGITDPAEVLEFTQDGTTQFYGGFFFWVNICALFLQSIVASRLLKYGGFAVSLLLLPVIALVSYSAMAFVPILAVVRTMKIAENATDYSINNTARHVLWLPVSAADKYKGKPAIDSLFVRIGDGLAALTVLVGVQVLSLSNSGYFAFTVFLTLAWLVGGAYVARKHRELSSCRGGGTGPQLAGTITGNADAPARDDDAGGRAGPRRVVPRTARGPGVQHRPRRMGARPGARRSRPRAPVDHH